MWFETYNPVFQGRQNYNIGGYTTVQADRGHCSETRTWVKAMICILVSIELPPFRGENPEIYSPPTAIIVNANHRGLHDILNTQLSQLERSC